VGPACAPDRTLTRPTDRGPAQRDMSRRARAAHLRIAVGVIPFPAVIGLGSGRRRHAFILALALAFAHRAAALALVLHVVGDEHLAVADIVCSGGAAAGARGAMAAVCRRGPLVIGPAVVVNLKLCVNFPTTEPLQWSSSKAPNSPVGGVRQVPTEALPPK
jgi:hypothetical protein